MKKKNPLFHIRMKKFNIVNTEFSKTIDN